MSKLYLDKRVICEDDIIDKDVEVVELGCDVKKIEDDAFRELGSLREVTCYSKWVTLGKRAFENCTSLEKVKLHTECIPPACFRHCGALREFDFAGVRHILTDAFVCCFSLEKVDRPEVEVIESFAFDGCTGLKEFESALPEAYISPYAFDEHVNVYRAEESAGVRLLRNGEVLYTGHCCTADAYVVPNTVKTIRRSAFRGARIASLMVSVEEIPSHMCEDCIWLSSLDLQEGVRHIRDYAFAGCQQLHRLVLPEGLESIGPYAFFCSGVETVQWPSTLRAIEEAAFSGIKLKETSLPDSVVYIGDEAFDGLRRVSVSKKTYCHPNAFPEDCIVEYRD